MKPRASVPAGVNSKPEFPSKERKRSQLVPLAIWSAPVFIVLAATILLADDQRNLRSLTAFLYGPATNRAEEQATIATPQPQASPKTGSPILARPSTETGPLIRSASAKERCQSLALQNQELPAYIETESFSQCTLLYRDGEDLASPSVFIQIQANQSGMVTSFRLKFNTQGKRAEATVLKGIELLQSYGGFFLKTEDFVPMLSERIGRWEPFRIILGPYLAEMDQEIVDPTRFNVFGRLSQDQKRSDLASHNRQNSPFRYEINPAGERPGSPIGGD